MGRKVFLIKFQIGLKNGQIPYFTKSFNLHKESDFPLKTFEIAFIQKIVSINCTHGTNLFIHVRSIYQVFLVTNQCLVQHQSNGYMEELCRSQKSQKHAHKAFYSCMSFILRISYNMPCSFTSKFHKDKIRMQIIIILSKNAHLRMRDRHHFALIFLPY